LHGGGGNVRKEFFTKIKETRIDKSENGAAKATGNVLLLYKRNGRGEEDLGRKGRNALFKRASNQKAMRF